MECNIVLVYAAVASMLLSCGTLDSIVCIYYMQHVLTKMTLATCITCNNIDCTSRIYIKWSYALRQDTVSYSLLIKHIEGLWLAHEALKSFLNIE